MPNFFGKKDVKGNKKHNKKQIQEQNDVCDNFNLILFFFNKLEELRDQNKVLRGAQRDIDRDRNQLEREKKRLVN